MRKLIVLEINEVPHKVFDHFKSKNPNSTLAKILDQSARYTTKSTDKGELHPWSTWPTFYRGVDNSVHGIKDIGENLGEINKNFPPVWDILKSNGISIGVFSSLHTYPLPDNYREYSFLVPDPFALGEETHPTKIQPFQAFNLAMTKKSGRSVNRGIARKEALKLVLALPGLGLRISTLLKTVNQLISEKLTPWKASRRRTFQGLLAFDIYLKLLKKQKPQFTTFFSNHVASSMHRYWAATFPEDYEKNELPQEWIDKYKNEIPYCMKQLDNMLKDIVTFIQKNNAYKLIIGSSMGQAATKAELVKQELFLANPEQFKRVFNGIEIEPLSAMHPQYNFKIAENNAENFYNALNQVRINNEPLSFRRKDNTFFSIDLGYPNIDSFEVTMNNQKFSLEDFGFEIREIDDQSGGTAYHIPEGSLFIYDPQNSLSSRDNTTIDLRDVAPSILRHFEIEPPKYMASDNYIL